MPSGITFSGLERYDFRDNLYRHMLEQYATEVNQPMPSLLRTWMSRAAQYVCCDLSIVREKNDIFKRAALIGFAWVRGTETQDLFAAEAIISSIRFFLSWEGTFLAEGCSERNVHDELVSDIRKIFSDAAPSLQDRSRAVYDALLRKCAKYWVCDRGNEKRSFKDKCCHQNDVDASPTASGQQKQATH